MADATVFQRMADRVTAMDQEEFAGAVVIVPPGGGDAIEFVISDPKPDPIQFFAVVKSRVEIAYAELVGRSEPSRGGWGG